MKKIILAVGAHPDDIELGCAGTLVKHIQSGDDVYALILTNGEKGNHDPYRDECLKSLKTLGIKKQNVFFGNFRDGYVMDDNETVSLIEKYIKQIGAQKVYTHDSNDRHQDHRHTSLAVSSAARKVPEIFLFQGPSTTSTFEAHYFIEIDKKQLTKKIQALKQYNSQTKKGIVNLKWVEDLAVTSGNSGNVPFAESFAINHISREGSNV